MADRLFFGPADDADKYELVEQISAYGDGTSVWKASLHVDGNHLPVVLKVVEGREEQLDEWWSQWDDIADRLRFLDHPGLAQVREHFVAAGPHPWKTAGPQPKAIGVVTQWIPGQAMADWIAADETYSVPRRVELVKIVAGSVEAMHAGIATGVSVAHGDVALRNLLMHHNEPVLVGYGFARLNAETSLEADRRAFGAFAFELLTGSEPNADAELNVAMLNAVDGLSGNTDAQRHILALQSGSSVPGNLATWAQSLAMLVNDEQSLAGPEAAVMTQRIDLTEIAEMADAEDGGDQPAQPPIEPRRSEPLPSEPAVHMSDPMPSGPGGRAAGSSGITPAAAAIYAAFAVALLVFLVSLFVG